MLLGPRVFTPSLLAPFFRSVGPFRFDYGGLFSLNDVIHYPTREPWVALFDRSAFFEAVRKRLPAARRFQPSSFITLFAPIEEVLAGCMAPSFFADGFDRPLTN